MVNKVKIWKNLTYSAVWILNNYRLYVFKSASNVKPGVEFIAVDLKVQLYKRKKFFFNNFSL